MPESICDTCGGKHQWEWEEAFDKFGFSDGDGQVETYTVKHVLERAGYEVELVQWGLHNTTVDSIKRDGIELLPIDDIEVEIGYDCPRDYLPVEVVELLDTKLSI